MNMTKGALALWCMSIGSTVGFSPPARFSSSSSSTRLAFVGGSQQKRSSVATTGGNAAAAGRRAPCSRTKGGCSCPDCTGLRQQTSHHSKGCDCSGCVNKRRRTILFADVAPAADVDDDAIVDMDDEGVPAEVVAMDGVESTDEAHNLERPARERIKKKKPVEGKSLSEFEVGTTVPGTVKSLASYGAFIDIGASTDGLLHVSQLSTEFVSDVTDVLKEGEKIDVRIIKIDTNKGQVGLSLISEEDASAAKNENRSRGGNDNRRSGGGGRRDNTKILSLLNENGWDTSLMVEGIVVSTTDFGAFVKVNAKLLNDLCEGEFDGLVHISAMKTDRVSSVTDVVNINDIVQVRCRSIDGNKVSLTMLSVEDEEAKASGGGGRGGGGGGDMYSKPVDMGAKDWRESLVKIEEEEQVEFANSPVIMTK